MLKDVDDICDAILAERPQFFILEADIGGRSVTHGKSSMTITCGKIDILPVRLDAAASCINSVSLYFRAPCESYFHFREV